MAPSPTTGASLLASSFLEQLALAAPSSLAVDVSEPAPRVESLIRTHLAAISRTARDLGVPCRDREDLVQDVLVVMVRRLADIEPGKERAFLLATTTRVVANWRRGHRRRPAELKESMDDVVMDEQAARAVAESPSEAAQRRQELELVRASIEAMTEPQRVAFVLFELEQLSAREIADQLGVSESVVFARVRRARVVFRRFCERAGAGRSQQEPSR